MLVFDWLIALGIAVSVKESDRRIFVSIIVFVCVLVSFGVGSFVC